MGKSRMVSAKCAICGEQIDAVRVTQKELIKIIGIETYLGFQCKTCGSHYCLQHNKMLHYKKFMGYTKGICPSCGEVFGEQCDVLFPPTTKVRMALENTENISMFKKLDIHELKNNLRYGKWLSNGEKRQQLIEEVKEIEGPLMKGIIDQAMPRFKSISSQGDAFLELAALGGIGAAWLLSDKYIDDALYQEIMDAIVQNKNNRAKLSAAILLIELSQLPDADDHIPHILAASSLGRSVLDSGRFFNPNRETSIIQWYFWGLSKFIDDERVIDFLIKMLDQPTHIMYDHKNYIHGPAYHAAELLLIYGGERGIAALVPAVLKPKKSIYLGEELFTQAYWLFNEPKALFSHSLIPKHGQLILLSKYLKEELSNENKKSRIRAAFALVMIRDKDGLEQITNLLQDRFFDKTSLERLGNFGNPQAIPFLLNLLPSIGTIAKKTLNNLKSVWTTTPFLEVLKHENKRVRLYAVQALGEIGDSSVITALNTLMEDSDRKVRKEANKAIKKLQ